MTNGVQFRTVAMCLNFPIFDEPMTIMVSTYRPVSAGIMVV